ncbi:MAG: hypothetical protein Q4D38_12895 [Planctomycetia bacterium]|nr:hypothetical protein [Planctomycetia bacterium]
MTDSLSGESDPVLECICSKYQDLLRHDGFGEMRIDIRILKRGQKEVIVSSGKQFRFVVDSPVSVRDMGIVSDEKSELPQ